VRAVTCAGFVCGRPQHSGCDIFGISIYVRAPLTLRDLEVMLRKISKRPLVLQPPAGFRTSRSDGAVVLSDGALMTSDASGLYRLDSAHAHLLSSFVGQGWHAPRPELPPMSELEHMRRAPPPNTKEILDLARRERIVLKTADGRLLMRGEPSALLRAHLRSASAALRKELARRDRNVWTEV
jgi:hypothetical protein